MTHRHQNERSALFARARALVVQGCIAGLVIGWSATAHAFQPYPMVVDTWLGKSGFIETIEKPMGCQLCHVSDQGGTVDLKPFGNLLVASYGLPRAAMEDAALMGVLAEVRAADPTLFADMQRGIDPNDDPALTAHELPQPEYGCAVATGRGGTGSRARRAPGAGSRGVALLLAIVPLASMLRRGRAAGRRT